LDDGGNTRRQVGTISRRRRARSAGRISETAHDRLDSPPQYEADAFLGFDPKAGDYIAHWLDRFGAPGARVIGQGKRNGEQLVISFPYADGAFRDTFTWRPATKSWALLLESQASNGAWSTFASYTLTHRALQ
jgi:hypothetical protein